MSGLTNPVNSTAQQASFEAAINQQINVAPSVDQPVMGAIVAGSPFSLGQLMAPSQKNRKATYTNNTTNKRFKFALQPIPVGQVYITYNDHYLGEMLPGGSMTIDDPEVRLGIWAICSDTLPGGFVDAVYSVMP